jgi:hypothetical protein
MKKLSPTKLGSLNFSLQEYGTDLYPAALNSRIYSAMSEGGSSYLICRKLSFAVYSDREQFFDSMALKLGWNVHRTNIGEMLMDSDGLFIKAEGFRKSDYCSCVIRIWGDSIDRAESAKEAILALADATKIRNPLVSICWAFLNSKEELQKAYIEELVDDTLYDEAYPELEEGVVRFISNYLESSESILVLQGPPGTGKTRLIRAILGEMATRRDEKVSALYTGDKKTMENDEIFVHFVTGDEEVFVIEDADYVLKPRTDGNDNLHRFLTIADGVVRSQGRKIIFSTNLPNVGDIDDALIRPGRCFARLIIRELSKSEAVKLLGRLCGGDVQKAKVIAEQLHDTDRHTFSVAEIYRQYDQACRLESGEEVIRRVSKNVYHRIGF